MTMPSVVINALNRNQSKPNAVEKTALFVGVGATNVNKVLLVSGGSNLDQLLGAADSELKKAVQTAKANSGDSANWFAYVYPMAQDGYDFQKAVHAVMEQVNVEFAVNTNTADATSANLNKWQLLYSDLLGKYSRRVFFIQAVAGIDTTETWAVYLAKLKKLTDNIVAEHVMAVPNLFGNDVGVLAGRLCHSATSIADTPARVKTGVLYGLGSTQLPKDKDDAILTTAHLKQIDAYRLSSAMWYADKEGFYWGDGNTLDSATGDYKVIENVRVVDKACRAVRLLAINKIGDRSFNSTAGSIEVHQTYFAQPLREMAAAITINGEIFPGEIMPPNDEAIIIQWVNKTTVQIYITVQPMDCPKNITVSIMLDLDLNRTQAA